MDGIVSRYQDITNREVSAYGYAEEKETLEIEILPSLGGIGVYRWMEGFKEYVLASGGWREIEILVHREASGYGLKMTDARDSFHGLYEERWWREEGAVDFTHRVLGPAWVTHTDRSDSERWYLNGREVGTFNRVLSGDWEGYLEAGGDFLVVARLAESGAIELGEAVLENLKMVSLL